MKKKNNNNQNLNDKEQQPQHWVRARAPRTLILSFGGARARGPSGICFPRTAFQQVVAVMVVVPDVVVVVVVLAWNSNFESLWNLEAQNVTDSHESFGNEAETTSIRGRVLHAVILSGAQTFYTYRGGFTGKNHPTSWRISAFQMLCLLETRIFPPLSIAIIARNGHVYHLQ